MLETFLVDRKQLLICFGVLFMITAVLVLAILAMVSTAWAQEEIDPQVIELVCPRGYYQNTKKNFPLLFRQECQPCPRGRYAVGTGSLNACPGTCPTGRFGPNIGATSVDECFECPQGTYGASSGLTTATCTSRCEAGKFSRTFGARSENNCLDCPVGYRGQQCNFSGERKTGTPPSGIIDP